MVSGGVCGASVGLIEREREFEFESELVLDGTTATNSVGVRSEGRITPSAVLLRERLPRRIGNGGGGGARLELRDAPELERLGCSRSCSNSASGMCCLM